MKRNIFFILLMVLFLISACQKVTSQGDGEKGGISYTNLYTEESMEAFKDLLLGKGIGAENVQRLLVNIDHFNQVVRGHTLIKEDFIPMEDLGRTYDLEVIQGRWRASHPDFIGFNCRITSFDLLQDYISIKNKERGDDSKILFDKSALENYSYTLFDSNQRANFETFFSQVPTEPTKDTKVHADRVKAFFQTRGVRFQMPEGVSLISLYLHDQAEKGKDTLFIGHSGVLIQDKDTLYFLEKLSFEEPYQVIKFPNKKSLRKYLMKKYDISQNQPIAPPLIFENGAPMED